MASVKFPTIRATCDSGHVTKIPYTPDAVSKTEGCTCPRDAVGSLMDYCYCPEPHNYFEWYCAECFPSQQYTVEVD